MISPQKLRFYRSMFFYNIREYVRNYFIVFIWIIWIESEVCVFNFFKEIFLIKIFKISIVDFFRF